MAELEIVTFVLGSLSMVYTLFLGIKAWIKQPNYKGIKLDYATWALLIIATAITGLMEMVRA